MPKIFQVWRINKQLGLICSELTLFESLEIGKRRRCNSGRVLKIFIRENTLFCFFSRKASEFTFFESRRDIGGIDPILGFWTLRVKCRSEWI